MQLRDLAALHEDVIRGLTSGLITVGRDGRILTFNAAAAEIVERSADGAVGRPIERDHARAGGAAGVGRRRCAAPRRGAPVSACGSTGEPRTLGVSVSPLVDANGAHVGRIVNFQDLTELRRMEAAVQRAERLAAVGRLAAGVAHEIRNPLAAISGSIELLAQTMSGDGAKENRELMSIVLREVERLNGLITELLEFARPRALEPQRLDVAATMAEMLRVFENDKRLGGARGDAGAPTSRSTSTPIRASCGRWCGTSCATRPRRRRSSRSPSRCAPPATSSRWPVSDRGPGIAVEHRARMFEPFFSTKEGGTGLGLATVHRIVEEHEGAVELDCPAAGGTTVTVTLPAAARSVAPGVRRAGPVIAGPFPSSSARRSPRRARVRGAYKAVGSVPSSSACALRPGPTRNATRAGTHRR